MVRITMGLSWNNLNLFMTRRLLTRDTLLLRDELNRETRDVNKSLHTSHLLILNWSKGWRKNRIQWLTVILKSFRGQLPAQVLKFTILTNFPAFRLTIPICFALFHSRLYMAIKKIIYALVFNLSHAYFKLTAL